MPDRIKRGAEGMLLSELERAILHGLLNGESMTEIKTRLDGSVNMSQQAMSRIMSQAKARNGCCSAYQLVARFAVGLSKLGKAVA